MLESPLGLAVLFWGAALADALSTWLAVAPHGGTLDHEINPLLRGSSWTWFCLVLLLLHGVIQLGFTVAWPRRSRLTLIAGPAPSLLPFSGRALWRFLTYVVPDACQGVYTAMTTYLAVTVAHLVAVANNLAVAAGRSGVFDGLGVVVLTVRPGMAPDEVHDGTVVLFYALATVLGVAAAHVWFVWHLRPVERAGESIVDTLVNGLPERAYRVGGVVLFAVCVVHKVLVVGSYANKALWALETAVFACLALFYAVRAPVVEGPAGPAEALVPLLGGIWPFLLLLEPRGAFGLRHQPELLLVMCAGTAVALWGYLYLNRAFTIMVEARVLKRGGPYRWVRHPVYAGQLVAAAAVVLWRWSPANLALGLAFAAIQVWRARLEERKLAAAFPEYVDYAGRTGMLVPRVAAFYTSASSGRPGTS